MSRSTAPVTSLAWTDISSLDFPIGEDDWVRAVVSTDPLKRWDAWLSMPRFRVCYDFPAWAVVVVAFSDEARGGALMQLFRDNPRQRRAMAFAICRTTRRLFRLHRLPIPVEVTMDIDEGLAVVVPAHHAVDTGYVPSPREWEDPERLMTCESLLADRTNWYESQCAQSARSGLWLPELIHPNVDSELGDFGWHTAIGEEPAVAARPGLTIGGGHVNSIGASDVSLSLR